MSETVTNDPTADRGPFVLNPPGSLSTGQAIPAPVPKGTAELPEKLEASEKEGEAEHQQYISDRDAATQRLHALERQRPSIPNQQQLGAPPDWKEYQKHAMGWAGAMAMMGALGAKAGRMSGTSALSAFNGALKGWQDGNLENYVNAGEKWKRESERTIESNRQLMQKYQLVLDNYRLNIDQQMAEIQRIAVENHDNMAYRSAKEGRMTEFAMLQDKRDEWTNGEKGLARTTAIMSEKYDQSVYQLKQMSIDYGPYVGANGENIDKFVNKDGTPWTNSQKAQLRFALEKFPPHDPDLLTGRGGDISGRLAQTGRGPQDIDRIATAIATGRQPPILTGLYGAAPAVRSALEAKGVDLAKMQMEWEAAKKQVSTLNGPQMTRFVGLGRSVVNTIDEVRDLSQQLKNSGVQLLNRAKLETLMQTEGNSPLGQLATRYIAATNTLKEEFANLAQGGYAPTEPVWKLANAQINENFGVDQMNASLTEIQRLINFRLNAIPGMSTIGPGTANPYTGSGGAAPAGGESTGWGSATVVGQ